MNPGERIGHYRIVSCLGTGGMGEVYLAHDERLERPVAVKILSQSGSADTLTMARLIQEAKATATLSHPNIAHVYEVGEEDGQPYLVMEYAEGQTLDRLFGHRSLPQKKILQIAQQAADALDDAHEKGIIHRDIKPSNLILSPRGQLKILDFGLAKLSEKRRRRLAPALTSTGSLSDSTLSGQMVGSIPYMSPEQASAAEVDGRTDIFSLGAVLYELATGRRAFAGATAPLVFDAILNRTPPAPRLLNPQIDEALDRLIRKCLEKDPRLRYQTAADLAADLRLMQRDSELTRAETRSRKDRRWVIGAGALAVLAIASTTWSLLRKQSEPRVASLRTIPLTSFPGSETQPSFSPDGTQVAFSWNQGKQDDLDLFVKVVDAGNPLQLTRTPESDISAAWSPDGKYIAFLRQSLNEAGYYLIPALGGAERKISVASPNRMGVDAPFVAWSPDAKTLAVVDRDTAQEPLSIFLIDVSTGSRRRLTTPPPKTVGDSTVVFAPNGGSLAFVRTSSLAIQDIHVVGLKDGEVKRLTFENRRVAGMVWNPIDGRIIFSSAKEPGTRLWRISPGGGDPERIIGVGDQASFLAYSAPTRRLAYTKPLIDYNIWQYKMPAPRTHEPEGVPLAASTRLEHGPRYSPDGRRIAFSSNSSGTTEIWVSDANGSGLTRLTDFGGAATGSAAWSPDGQWIAFDSRPGGNPDIYVVSVNGGSSKRMTQDPSQEVAPSWSRDGKWLYFSSNRTGRYEVWRMPAGGGEATQVTRYGGFFGVESPDGRYLYYVKALNMAGLWRMPVSGAGEEAEVLPRLPTGYQNYWSFGKSGIYYVEREEVPGGGASYPLRYHDLRSGRDSIITHLKRRPFNSGLSVSPDEKRFLYTQVDTSEIEIMLVEGFQ